MDDFMTKINKLAILKTEYKALEDSFKKDNAEMESNIKDLEAEIKQEVLKMQKSVKGEGIDVIYCKGKTSWDGKLLAGYAVAHPEILAAKKEGQPTVSFKLIKE